MITNRSRKKTLAKRSKLCTSLISQAKGLMFSLSMKQSLIFSFQEEKHNHLHMFFVPYPIDVLWLDKNKRVVQIKEQFKPFTFARNTSKSMYVLELPAGTILETGTKKGDKINFKE